MKKNKLNLRLLFAITALLAFASCKSEDPEEENEGELITDVILRFTEIDAAAGPGTPFEVKASDPQGLQSGTTPTIETINLAPGKLYRLEIRLLNSIEGEEITEEIEEEMEEHQFFFLGTAFAGSPIAQYEYLDADADGNPVGLEGLVQVSGSPATNNAIFRLVLRHDLDKNFPGANNPHWQNFTQAGGETDLDISFPLVLN